MTKKKSNALQYNITLISAITACWCLSIGYSQAGINMQEINNKIINNAIDQYEIVKRNGTPTDICVQSAAVTATFLSIKDEPNYIQWKQIQKNDCRRAGLSE